MKLKKYMLAGMLCAFGIMQASDSYAFKTTQGTVKNKGINIRSEAGMDSKVLSSAKAGAKLQIVDKVTGTDGNEWYVIFVDGSKKGYIRSDLITLDEEQNAKENQKSDSTMSGNIETSSTQVSADIQSDVNATDPISTVEENDTVTKTGTGRVKGTGVRLRSSSSTSSEILATCKNNKKVSLLKKVVGADAKTWYQVSITISGKKQVGYIRSDLLKIVKEITVKDKKKEVVAEDIPNGAVKGVNVNVRMQPVDGMRICKLSTNHTVTIKEKVAGNDGKEWYYILFTYSGVRQEGYIRSDYVVAEQNVNTTNKEENTSQESTQTEQTERKSAQIKGINVRIRQSAVNGTVLCQESSGFAVTIIDELIGSDGKLWYQVSFIKNQKEQNGFVRSDLVTFSEETAIIRDEAFEAELDKENFPESYRIYLRALHEKHPNWIFKAAHTGLDWSEVVSKESVVGRNFVSKNSIVSYKSLDKTAYNLKENRWYTFDGGSWVAASEAVVSYYLDPRNFFDDEGIFQFETLEYREYQTVEGVSKMLKSTFMKGNFTEPDGSEKSYAQTFVDIGKSIGVNPYHLAARCYQEQGNGKSGSISGKVKGYENLFNYFNIGAYATNGNSPVTQGLIYASKTSEKYGRPWNSHYRSLLGGSTYLADKYIKKGQNTLYFQKFNVVNKTNGLYTHQYMTNLLAACSEAAKMKKAYGDNDYSMEFVIPVYHNMPSKPCTKPTANVNPNNYLKELKVSEYTLSPAFDAEVTEYALTVEKSVKSVKISAKTVAGTSTVEGMGNVKLQKGLNTITLSCKSQEGMVRTYTIHITRKKK